MSNAEFSPGGNEPVYVRPEFTLIDERNQQMTYFDSEGNSEELEVDEDEIEGELEEELEEESEEKESLDWMNDHIQSLRLVSFLGLIFSLIYGTFVFVTAVISTIIVLFSLFRDKEANQFVSENWKSFFNTMIAGVACAVGIIFPRFGVKLLTAYFALIGKPLNDHYLFSRFL